MFLPTSTLLQAAFTAVPLAPGCFIIKLEADGLKSDFYRVKVISEDAPPPVPSLLSAAYTSDGTELLISFDSDTAQGTLRRISPCSEMFFFLGATRAECSWVSPTQVRATLDLRSIPEIGTDFSLRNNTVWASCESAEADNCASFARSRSQVHQQHLPFVCTLL